jgi:trehalose/maltose hydrolase-like predicted phosphorylase
VRTPFSVWDEVSVGKGVDHFTTGPGGFLQAITHGYGGASLGDEELTLRPSLPENADRLKLRRFAYLGVWLSLGVDATGIHLEALPNEEGGEEGVQHALEVSAGAGVYKPLVPGQPRVFKAGATLTVRGTK